MVTEFVLILTAMLVVISVFTKALSATFKGSGPKLGARVEKLIETGSGFPTQRDGSFGWQAPPKKAEEK